MNWDSVLLDLVTHGVGAFVVGWACGLLLTAFKKALDKI